MNYDMIFIQGEDFQQRWQLLDRFTELPLDLTGATVDVWFRRGYRDEPLLKLADEGYISIGDPVAGEIQFDVPASVTDVYDFSQLVYDLRIVWHGGDVTKPVYGRVVIRQGVTLS